ncbi:MAG: sel1 repeat family protein [Polyangiaceae bacterium]|nr:sel1 repeat family protein [Polyangiaceae bacterium]
MPRRFLPAVFLASLGCTPPPPPPPPPPAPTLAASSAPAASSSSPPPTAPSVAPPPPTPATAADLGRAACKSGELAGCDVLAEHWGAREFLTSGRAAEASEDGAILKQACEGQRVSSACMGYALMLKYGTATGKRDNGAAKPYWDMLPALGDLNGFRSAPSEAGQAALRAAERDCEQGRARACNQLGWAAYNGVQREKSLADSYRFYAEACRLQSPQGCRWSGHLAFVYDELRQGKQARGALEQGCKSGNPSACAELGQFLDQLESGVGALALYEKGCADGARDGCLFAAKKKMGDKKLRKEEATELLRRACEAEQEEACGLLGPLLERGEGIKKDEGAAAGAYTRACKGKIEGSCEALARLAGAGKGEKCILDPKPPERIGEEGAAALRAACKENGGAPWCRGVKSCPERKKP